MLDCATIFNRQTDRRGNYAVTQFANMPLYHCALLEKIQNKKSNSRYDRDTLAMPAVFNLLRFSSA